MLCKQVSEKDYPTPSPQVKSLTISLVTLEVTHQEIPKSESMALILSRHPKVKKLAIPLLL